MRITDEWLASVQDEEGLTKGQQQLLTIWAKRQAYVGFGYLPDRVAHVIETCKGYRRIPEDVRVWLLQRS